METAGGDLRVLGLGDGWIIVLDGVAGAGGGVDSLDGSISFLVASGTLNTADSLDFFFSGTLASLPAGVSFCI